MKRIFVSFPIPILLFKPFFTECAKLATILVYFQGKKVVCFVCAFRPNAWFFSFKIPSVMLLMYIVMLVNTVKGLLSLTQCQLISIGYL